MGVLECHQLTPPNNMVELKTHKLCVKNQVEFMVLLEWVDVEFGDFFFPAKPTSTHTYGKKARISVSGHETQSTGSPNSGKTPVDWGSCPDTEIRVFSGMQVPVDRVSSPCQDMKPGPR
jgi:hypothetical protein